MDESPADLPAPEELKNQTADESLANVPPSPLSAPDTHAGNGWGLNAALFTAAGGGALFLLSGLMTPCVGATRSAKLEWEKRQLQIEQAASEARDTSDEIK